MKDLNVRQKSIKILEENTGSNLFDLGHSNFFARLVVSKDKGNKGKNWDYWDFIKKKAFAQKRKQSTKPKDNQQNGKRYLQISYQING